MKFKCPECDGIFESDKTMPKIKEMEASKMSNPLLIDCPHCPVDYIAIDNIQYKPPTGGTGEVKCDCQFCQQKEQIENLEAQLDANKNCLNCKSFFMSGSKLMCKITGKEMTLKICEKWSQL